MPEEEAAGRRAEGMAHVPALDGLRGAAVAAVLWFHAGHLRGGYLGVDLFFTLSGYLITSLLVTEWRSTGGVRLLPFWSRRIRRLLPALVLMLVAVGLVAHWRVLPGARGALRDSGLATLGYVANWHTIRSGNGYWDQALTPSWLEHTWSLAIEEQFYVVWPLVVLAVLVVASRRRPAIPGRAAGDGRTRRVRILGLVALVGGVASAAAMVVGAVTGASIERLYLGTDTRVAAILLGAAVACFQRAQGRPAAWPAPARTVLAAVAVIAVAGLVAAWSLLEGTSALLYRGGLLACGVAAAVVIVDITTPGPSPIGWLLARAPLRALGAISYGLYLYHWPIFRYVEEADLGLGPTTRTAVAVAVSLLVAAASFRFVEQPILRGRWTWMSVRMAPIGVVAAVAALLVASIGAVDVAPPPDGEAVRPVIERHGPARRVPVSAAAVGPAADPTRPGSAPTPLERLVDPVVLVVGDSVGFSLVEEGFAPRDGDLGLTAVNGAVVGCSLMRDIGAEPPPEATYLGNCSGDWPALVEEYRPDVVVVLFGALVGIKPISVDGPEVYPCTERYEQRWRERLVGAVDVLSSTGAQIELVTAPPASRDYIPDPEAAARQGCANRTVHQVADAEPDATVIDLAEWTCPDGDCREEADGEALRPDGLHFSGRGAEVVAEWMAEPITIVAAA